MTGPLNKRDYERAQAFNHGSDARIGGRPRAGCPFTAREKGLWTYWTLGWDHCHAHWGVDSLLRPVAPLPPVPDGPPAPGVAGYLDLLNGEHRNGLAG